MTEAEEGVDAADHIQDEPEELFERMAIRVDKGQAAERIDKFLARRIQGITRNRIQQAIDAGHVLVNSKTTQSNYKIRQHDEIIVYTYQEAHDDRIVPEKMPLNIIFEDAELIVLNKPAGLVVHPASGNYTGTLVNGLSYHLLENDKTLTEETLPRFGLVHRIDKNTTGLMVAAKTANALAYLAKQFFDHTVKRRYIALVWGDMEADKGTIVAHIGRHKRFRKQFDAYPDGDSGKDAITHYEVVERFGYVTLVTCVLETGRTHQIRVHMQHIGHPLFNDDTYGGDKIVKGTIFNKYKQFVENCFEICPRHALHAKTLGFRHPITKEEMLFDSELPSDMARLIEKWKGYVRSKTNIPQ